MRALLLPTTTVHSHAVHDGNSSLLPVLLHIHAEALPSPEHTMACAPMASAAATAHHDIKPIAYT